MHWGVFRALEDILSALEVFSALEDISSALREISVLLWSIPNALIISSTQIMIPLIH